MKGIQKFSDAYLEQSRRMSPESVIRFLEDFRLLHATRPKSRLISLKVPEPLLEAFKLACQARGERYQTKIKALMLAWLERDRGEPPGA